MCIVLMTQAAEVLFVCLPDYMFGFHFVRMSTQDLGTQGVASCSYRNLLTHRLPLSDLVCALAALGPVCLCAHLHALASAHALSFG